MDNEDHTKYRRAGMFASAHLIALYFFGWFTIQRRSGPGGRLFHPAPHRLLMQTVRRCVPLSKKKITKISRNILAWPDPPPQT